MQLDLMRSTAALEGLAEPWQQLWLRDPAATPFQSPAWLLPWWRQFGQPELRVVTLTVGQQLCGLLLAYIYPEPATGERQVLLLGAGTSDYCDGLFLPECADADLDAAVRLLTVVEGWDRAYFGQVRAESRLGTALTRAGWARAAAESCSRIQASLMQSLPKKLRLNLHNYLNRARRAGTLAFASGGLATWEDDFSELLRLHTARWQSRGEAGVLGDARVVAWHREALPGLLAQGLARLSILRLNDRTIAALYSLTDPPLRERRTESLYLIGFDAEFAALSPGTLIFSAAIERACEEGFQVADFLRGGERYKQFWGAMPAETFGYSLSFSPP